MNEINYWLKIWFFNPSYFLELYFRKNNDKEDWDN